MTTVAAVTTTGSTTAANQTTLLAPLTLARLLALTDRAALKRAVGTTTTVARRKLANEPPSGYEPAAQTEEADLNGDGDVTVVEAQKSQRKSDKKDQRKNDNNAHNDGNGGNGNNNGNGGNSNNNNNGNGGSNGNGNNGGHSQANNNNNGGQNNNGHNNNNGGNNNDRHRMGLAAGFVASWGGGTLGDTASAGNGGRANSSADGGIVVIGKINSGGNKGNTVNVGDIGGGGGDGSGGGGTCGPVYIDGGNVDNSTNLNIDASGGTAISDASGGSGNVATLSDDGNDHARGGPIRSRYGIGARGGGSGTGASAGNGGIAGSSADGGIVVIDEINSGGNEGNTVNVGDICAGPAPVYSPPAAPAKPGKPGKPSQPVGRTVSAPVAGGSKVKVVRVPSTGVGTGSSNVPAPQPQLPALFSAALPSRRDEESADIQEDSTKL